MTEWLLYTDESGNFDRDEPDTVVAVVGVLLELPRGTNRGDFERKFRSDVERVYPHVGYPPHASILNTASAHLYEWLKGKERGPGRGSAGRFDEVEAPYDVVCSEHRESRSLTNFRNCVSRKVPSYWVFVQLDETLCEMGGKARVLFATLAEIGRACSRRFAKVLLDIAQETRAFVVAGAEYGHSLEEASRYRSLFQAQYEVVWALLGSRPGQEGSTVQSIVAHRPMEHIGIASHDETWVNERIAEARRFPLGTDDCPNIVCREVAVFDDKTPSGLVLADFVANRLRYQLRYPSVPWRYVREGVRENTGLEVAWRPVSGLGKVTCATLAGLPAGWSLVRDAFRRHSTGESPRFIEQDGWMPCWARGASVTWRPLIESLW